MTNLKASFAPRNSIVFIVDPDNRFEVPGDAGSELATFTNSCIAVGTLAEMDGVTSIQLGSIVEIPDGGVIFSGTIDTPNRQIGVIDVPVNVHLLLPVRSSRTLVTVWANDPSEPDRIIIQVSSSDRD